MQLNKQQRRIVRIVIVIILLAGLANKSTLGNGIYWTLFILCGLGLNYLEKMAKREKAASQSTAEEPVEPKRLSKAERDKISKKRFAYIFFGILAVGMAVGISEEGSDFFKVDTVKASSWDGSVEVVERYLKNEYLRDPASYESVKWGKLSRNSDGIYQVTHSFRAKNGFGGMNQQTLTFFISEDGSRVISCQ